MNKNNFFFICYVDSNDIGQFLVFVSIRKHFCVRYKIITEPKRPEIKPLKENCK